MRKLDQNKKNNLFLIIYLLLIIAGIGIASISFIPSWEKIERNIIFIAFFIALVCGIVFLIKNWIATLKYKNTFKYIQAILISILIIGSFFPLFMIYLTAGKSGFLPGPYYIKEFKIKNTSLYLYEQGCSNWLNGSCSCDDYYSIIYIKDNDLPIMHIKGIVDFYVDTIEQVDNNLIIKASTRCDRGRSKDAVISIE